MDESGVADGSNTRLLPAHRDGEEGARAKGNGKNGGSAPKSQPSNSSITKATSPSACTLDMFENNHKTSANETALTTLEEQHDNASEGAAMPPQNTAPIAKIITIKTYRPAKVFAAFVLFASMVVLVVASITSEWLTRYNDTSPRATYFYRYGFFEFCHGQLNPQTEATRDFQCEFWPLLQKSWVQICFSLYVATFVIAAVAFALLCIAFKLDTDNLSKWRLYKTTITLLLIAGFLLAACMLIWSARFLFEVSILHGQKESSSPGNQGFPATANKEPRFLAQMALRPRRRAPVFIKAAPESSYPSSNEFGDIARANEKTNQAHDVFWSQVMATVSCGWGYILAWVDVALIILPAVLLIVDGKKDEHICEEQLVYPHP